MIRFSKIQEKNNVFNFELMQNPEKCVTQNVIYEIPNQPKTLFISERNTVHFQTQNNNQMTTFQHKKLIIN
jgi:hypothetical protein